MYMGYQRSRGSGGDMVQIEPISALPIGYPDEPLKPWGEKYLYASPDPEPTTETELQGSKYDSGKPQAGTVIKDFSNALMAISELGTFGIHKYGPSNWLYVPDGITRYTNAMGRHLLLEEIEKIDPETDMLHAVSTAWNALARLELIIREQNRSENHE